MKKHKVTVNYGPYMSFGLLEYRTARLEGIQGIFEAIIACQVCLVTVAMSEKQNNFCIRFGHFIGNFTFYHTRAITKYICFKILNNTPSNTGITLV